MRLVSCVAVGLVSFLILLGTSEMLPFVWDEGELIERAASVKTWGEQAFEYNVSVEQPAGHLTPLEQTTDISPYSRESIAASWKCTTVVEGHPGGYLVVIAVGKKLAECCPMIPQKTAWRFGPILLMSIALAVTFSCVRRHFGNCAALFSVMTILLMPHVFAHAHFATCDSVLMAAWLLAFATFPLGHAKPLTTCSRWSLGNTVAAVMAVICAGVIWGTCLGLTLAAKFTGFACTLPFLMTFVVTLVWNRKSGVFWHVLFSGVIGCMVAAVVFYLLNPPIWHDPLSGFDEFIRLNLHRDKYNVAIFFWGRMYDLYHSLPWYNTIVWVMICTPVLFLLMLPFGLQKIFFSKQSASNPYSTQEWYDITRTRKTLGVLLTLNAVVLLVARAFPGTPPHDGTRLFIAGFPFLAIISGIGISRLWETCANVSLIEKQQPTEAAATHPINFIFALKQSKVFGYVRRSIVVLIFLVGLSNMILYAPQWLSYYNIIIGGVSRAQKQGFEATYYWDGLDAEVIDWLNQKTGPHEKIRFSATSSKMIDLVRSGNGLQPEFRSKSPGVYRWYVMQLRPSGMSASDWWLCDNAVPVFRKTIKHGHNIPFSTAETPILQVFDDVDYQKSVESTREIP